MLLRARGLDGVPEVLVQQREVSRLKVSREAFPGGYRATGENDAAGHYIQDSAGCSASDVIAGSVLGSTLVESRQRKWVNKAGRSGNKWCRLFRVGSQPRPEAKCILTAN